MKKILLLTAVLLLSSLASGQELVGARALGMGSAYTSVVDDATALRWNPGAIGILDQRTLSGGFSRLYLGVDNDAIGQGFMGYAQKLGGIGNVGLGWTNLFSNVYSENTFHLGYGYDLGTKMPAVHTLGIGFTANMVMTGYNTSEFVPNPDEAVDIRNSSLFSGGTSTMGVSVDFGVLFKPNPKASAALVLNNINQPNTSLDGVESGAVPLSGAFGFSYRISDFLIPSVDLRFINWDINDKNKFEYNVGVEGWFSDKTIGVRTGINPNEFSAGATYNIFSKPSWQVNYAFLYPLSKMGKVSTTHRVSLTARMPYKPPKPKKLNFEAISLEFPESTDDGIYINESTILTGKFIKTGKLDAKDVKITALIETPEGKYEKLGTKELSSVRSDDTISLTWSFERDVEGEFKLLMHVDDDGANMPSINGMIKETDEKDNIAQTSIRIKKVSEINIALEAKSLKITKASIRKTEEPQVPAVFFDLNSITADSRYDYMLTRVSERLADNPDAVLVLRGYHSAIGEQDRDDLAISRALVVYRKLLMMNVKPEQLRVDSTGYDLGKTRAREQYALDRDKRMIAQENRRVELSVEIPRHATDLFEEYEFSNGDDGFNGTIENAELYRRLLSNNEHFVVLAKGVMTSAESQNDPTLGLRRASSIKEKLAKSMSEYEDRIYIFDRVSENGDSKGSVKMLAEGILYKPYETETMPTSVELSDRENRVSVDFNADANIQSHEIYIQREDGEIVKTIAIGNGAPEREYLWDWTDDNGEILAPGSEYHAVGKIVDERGTAAEAKSDGIHVEVKEIVDIIENILIVNFNFDTPTPVSEFFETRLDMTARKFIEDAQREDFRLRATVEGHTDVVGNKARNSELSKERSLREYNNIKRYMKYLLDLKTDSQLKNWMKETGSNLDYLGAGFSKPYQIKKQVAGSEVEVLVGDNKLPEGRNVNRRVIIEYKLLPKN